MSSRSFAVRVEYRDGSSRLFGPTSSRAEARTLLDRVNSPLAESCNIVGWTGGAGRGGVLSSRPAPTAPVVVEPEPTPLTYTALTSPAADTLRIVGTGFDGVARLAFGFSNGSMYASNTTDPLEGQTNSGNGVTITTWTDTLVEFVSPYMPTGSVLAVDFQDTAYTTLAEWLNDNLDPANGFPVFSVA